MRWRARDLCARCAGCRLPLRYATRRPAVLLTLIDHETPLWLDPAAAAARAWIAFHTGAPIETAKRAAFAMALSLPDLAELPSGSDEMPETSATVILQTRFADRGPAFRAGRPRATRTH